MDRRDFLRLGIGGAAVAAHALAAHATARGQSPPTAAGATASSAAQDAAAPPPTATLDVYERLGRERMLGRVVAVGGIIPSGRTLASNRDALAQSVFEQRLQAGMEALLGPEPWAQICGPEDVVAIKLNALAPGLLAPRPELVRAVAARLIAAGVRARNIILWDFDTRMLEECGFPRQTGPGEVRVYGTDALRGGGYGESFEFFGAVGSLVSRIVTEYATVLINVSVLKAHDLSGVSVGMKNLYGAIHNPNRYHDNNCDPFIPQVVSLPSIRAKLRLTVIDAVLGQADGGPSYSAAWIWPCDRVLLAVDPVACDRAGADLIEARRAAIGLPSLGTAGRPPRFIRSGAQLGLGHDEGVQLISV